MHFPYLGANFKHLICKKMPTFISLIKAVACAVILNCVLFWAGKATGILSNDILLPNIGQPLRLGAVISSSVLPIIVAAGILYLLSKVVAKPKPIFTAISVVVLLLSFLPPFLIPNVSIAMTILLNLMHVVVAGSVLYFFQSYTGLQKTPAKPQV